MLPAFAIPGVRGSVDPSPPKKKGNHNQWLEDGPNAHGSVHCERMSLAKDGRNNSTGKDIINGKEWM